MRSINKTDIEVAARMYKCQSSAMILFGSEYESKIKWYVDTLKGIMRKENLNEVQAVVFVSKLESVQNDGMAILLFTAAAVEMAVASNEK